jgi:hypothetical protein
MIVAPACSDDDQPGTDGSVSVQDGQGAKEFTIRDDMWSYPDGMGPCPAGGPCVLEKKGEGKHAWDPNVLVIGEILTLTGKDLSPVDTVYLGAAPAVLLSKSDTEIKCKVGPKTPPGEHTLEVKAGSSRRMFSGVKVTRLAVVAAADHPKLQLFHSATHSAAMELDLAEAPEIRPSLSPSGRYLVSRGKTKLMVADLAQEVVAVVAGLGADIVDSWAIDSRDKVLFISAANKLLYADLSSFPTLTTKEVTAAPATAGLGMAEPGLVAGLGVDGTVWHAPENLSAFTTVKEGASSFVIGSGSGIKQLAFDAMDGAMTLLALDGSSPHLAVLSVASGLLKDPSALSTPGAFAATIASGGKFIAVSDDAATPTLSYLPMASPAAAKSVTLGGTGAKRLVTRRLPTLTDQVAILVGSQTTGTFKADTIEVVDLAKGVRLTSGGGAALSEADLRDAEGDPIADKLHIATGTHYRIFGLSITNSTIKVTEEHPHQLLTAGKDYRWLLMQP